MAILNSQRVAWLGMFFFESTHCWWWFGTFIIGFTSLQLATPNLYGDKNWFDHENKMMGCWHQDSLSCLGMDQYQQHVTMGGKASVLLVAIIGDITHEIPSGTQTLLWKIPLWMKVVKENHLFLWPIFQHAMSNYRRVPYDQGRWRSRGGFQQEPNHRDWPPLLPHTWLADPWTRWEWSRENHPLVN